ncbi:hypothetical protein D0Y65_032345 [Glycine soja]|uniref:Uncharacterized protein n=1 Tax=Glycine soja TaxID=3848 RepID=A0A445ICM6_GLYSO|nr:hypothetical protein D0Y65_032345 [Glycine soja]
MQFYVQPLLQSMILFAFIRIGKEGWALTQTIRLLPCDLNIIDSNPSPCPIRGVSCIERERRRQQREATIANSST